MIPKRIIEKAVEGGWKSICSNCQCSWIGHKQTRIGNHYCTTGPDQYRTALDRTFWIALGKALGWFTEDGRPAAKYINNDPKHTQMDMHIWYAHRSYDLILTGGDTDKFWEEILPTNHIT